MFKEISVIVVTSCHFLFSGLVRIVDDSHLNGRLIQVNGVDDILELQVETSVNLIVVISESDIPSVKVRDHVIMCKLDYHMQCGVLRRIPVVYITGKMKVLIGERFFFLTREYLARELVDILMHVLINSDDYCLKNFMGGKSLSSRQKEILECTLAGKSISEIAEAMSIQPGVVFSHRSALIQKLGFRNRIELFLLKSYYC